MSEKTKAELKEQIKIMNHNYQVIREMHERGYQYSVGEIKRLQDELDRTRKALEWARHFLKEIRLRYLFEKDNPSRQNKWADTALYMYNCAESFFDDYDKTALEQKDK